MNARTISASITILSAAVFLTGGVARAQDCQPSILAEYGQAQAGYDPLLSALAPTLPQFTTDLQALTNQATYATLLAHANTLAGALGTGGRVVITVPDGTVVVDTSKGGTNTFANFQAKTINENHNSRLAFLAAQEYPCGVGIERKFSTTTNAFEITVAARVGDHLSSFGTVRVSK